jgi:hypothetical protein
MTFKISIKLVLLSFFTTVFIFTWVLPLVLILNGAEGPIQMALHLLVNETSSSIKTALARDMRVFADHGFSLMNWSDNYGTPYDNETNFRDHYRKTFGWFLSERFMTRSTISVFYEKDATQLKVLALDDDENMLRYQVCKTATFWNDSLSTTDQDRSNNESLLDCTVEIMNRSSGELFPALAASLGPRRGYGRAWANSPNHRFIKQRARVPTYYRRYQPLGIFFLNIGSDALGYSAAVIDPDTFIYIVTLSFNGFSSTLLNFLPSGTSQIGARSFLLSPNSKTVIAASHGVLYEIYPNFGSSPSNRECYARFSNEDRTASTSFFELSKRTKWIQTSSNLNLLSSF